jgi:hypothetical protein
MRSPDRIQPVISTEAMRSIAQWRNLFKNRPSILDFSSAALTFPSNFGTILSSVWTCKEAAEMR